MLLYNMPHRWNAFRGVLTVTIICACEFLNEGGLRYTPRAAILNACALQRRAGRILALPLWIAVICLIVMLVLFCKGYRILVFSLSLRKPGNPPPTYDMMYLAE